MTTATPTRIPPAEPDPARTQLSHRQVLTILSGLLLGMFLAALDQNIVSVAIVRIANDLNGFDEQAWATTAYLITATITTPLYGKLADIYGRKPFYLVAIALFIIGSAACTFAGSMYQLAGFRAFQGLGAGGLMSLAMTIIGDLVPARERARYQGYFMMVFGSATVLGPVLGGFFSDLDSLAGLDGWRWVFLVNVPVGVLALVVVAKVLNVPHQRQPQRIDWFGAIMLAVCVVPLLIVAERGREWGWGAQESLICYGVGGVGFVLFVLIEMLMKDAALIPMRLFRNSTFSIVIFGGFILGVAMFGAITMVPQYFQVVRGYSPTEAGLLMLPLVVGIMSGSLVSGQIMRRTGRYKVLPVTGTFIVAVGAVLYAQVHYDSPLWQPLGYGAVIGLGLGCCMQTLIIAAQNAGPKSDMGVSTASATFFRQMGGTLGVAIFLTILFNLLPTKITEAFGGLLPPGFDAAKLSDIQSNTSGIAALPDAVKVPVLTGFTEAMHGVFYTAAGVALLAFVVLLCMREIPLRDDPASVDEHGADESDTAAAAQTIEEAVPAESEKVLVGAGARPQSADYDTVTFDDAPPAVVAMSSVGGADGFVSGRKIHGRVHRENGWNVPNAALTLIDQRGRQVGREYGGGDGGYLIDVPASGTYVLIASAAGHQPAAVNIVVDAEPQTVDIALLGSGEVSGVVRSASRSVPVAGATVTVTDPRGEVVGTAVSAADGAYSCHGVVAGTYTLVAVADHMRPAATTLVVPDSGRLEHDIELEPNAVLAGSALADGRAVADVQIAVLDASGDITASARTDEDGHYLVPDLAAGDYTVVARGYPPVTSTVTVAGGEVAHDVQLGYQY